MTEPRHRFRALSGAVSAGVVLVLAPGFAPAYVGPGVGLSALGSVLAFIGAVLLLIVGFLWYPIKRLLKRCSKPDAEDDTASGDADKAGDR